jgi:hypothetical protein
LRPRRPPRFILFDQGTAEDAEDAEGGTRK